MNYWIFQSNPRRFPIKQLIMNVFSEKLPEKYQKVSSWRIENVPNNPNKKIMRPDDIVFIWKSDGGERSTKGIYAKARIISIPPHKEPYTRDTIAKIYKEAGLDVGFTNPGAERNKEEWPYVIIRYTHNLLESPLLAQEFTWIPELKSLRILRFFQRTLYDDVTEEQGQILHEMAEWKCKAESLNRNASRVSSAMHKFTVSLPKTSFAEAQLQAVKLDLTLNDFIIRAVNRFIMDKKVYEETQRYSEMEDEAKIAYLKKLFEERRALGIPRYYDQEYLDDAIKSGDYKIALICDFLEWWLIEKYELVYPSGCKW